MHRRSSLQFLLTFLLLAPVALLSGCGVTIPKAAPAIGVSLANPNPPANSGAQAVNVNVVRETPGPAPTGTLGYQVTVPSSQVFSGPLSLPSSTFSVDITDSGAYVIQVQYSGDKNYASSTVTYTLSVAPAASSSSGSAIKLYKGYPRR
ncbi:MAG: hypothetical protein ACR2JE_09715 [Acidobacteriaceae bacterium]